MNYLSDEDYDFIYQRVPRICVDLLILNSKGETLLTKRDIEPYKDHWHLPGGRIKFREPIIDAVNRILKSELGQNIRIEQSTMVGFCEFREEVQKSQERHSISMVFLVELPEHATIKIDGNASESGFFSKLPEPMIPSHGFFLTVKYPVLK